MFLWTNCDYKEWFLTELSQRSRHCYLQTTEHSAEHSAVTTDICRYHLHWGLQKVCDFLKSSCSTEYSSGLNKSTLLIWDRFKAVLRAFKIHYSPLTVHCLNMFLLLTRSQEGWAYSISCLLQAIHKGHWIAWPEILQDLIYNPVCCKPLRIRSSHVLYNYRNNVHTYGTV